MTHRTMHKVSVDISKFHVMLDTHFLKKLNYYFSFYAIHT